ncbi:M23 family metallopeptidase [Croceibacterium ferulae]|uniref:M23 family metallopeptidase n=1 Tax=Croceibacterium ferulae TaxID=1854641 RepID=UPI000EB0D7DD|nr:M23 family metallopeptidase [Croceibacterium ferulae]
MRFFDRLLTVIITATLTSAAWIIVGGGWSPQRQTAQTDRIVSEAAAPVGRSQGSRFMPVPGTWSIPVQGVAAADLVDTFDDRRGDDEERTHEALDIMAPRGTPVLAATDGLVEKLFTSRAGGLTIYTRGADGRTLLYYAHLQSYAPGLAEGQQVRTGQVLGSVGSTGNADAGSPHLHFAILRTSPGAEWWEPARAINPFPVLTGQ